MKNLTTLLQNGNLTPKERYLLLIQSDIAKEITGKETLTEADKEALSNWHARTNEEAREWNKYNEGWKLFGRAGLEAEILYLETKGEYFRKFFLDMQLNFYPFNRSARNLLEKLEKIKVVDIKEANKITDKQQEQKLKDGIDFDYAVYKLAFESLNSEDQKRFTELYPDVEFDHQYLDQEEIIANLFNSKNELSKKAKEKLAGLVAERSYNKYAKQYQLFHYFACIPIAEVARQFLINKGIELNGKSLAKNQEADDEDSHTHDKIQKALEIYAKDNNLMIEVILKGACLKWLDEDLFDQYCPLVISNEKELLDRWLKTKAEARATLQKLVMEGKLKTKKRTAYETMQDKLYSDGLCDSELENAEQTMEFLNLEVKTEIKNSIEEKTAFAVFNDQVITGESLYNFKEDYKFIKEFKERVDQYDANLGIVYANDDPEHRGNHLDQELLVSTKNNKGELNVFSMFGLSLKILKATFESTQFVKETKENGEIILDFNNELAKTIFREVQESLVDCYSKLLAFKKIGERLSKTYEADLTHHFNSRLLFISDFIDRHNDALKRATGQKADEDEENEKPKNWFTKYDKVLKFRDDLFIDKDAILPDAGIVEEWNKKFEDILGYFF